MFWYESPIYYNEAARCVAGCGAVGTHTAFAYTAQGLRYETVACVNHAHPSAKKLLRRPFTYKD